MCLKKSPKILKGNSNLEVGTKDKESQTEKQYYIKLTLCLCGHKLVDGDVQKRKLETNHFFRRWFFTIFENDQTEHIIHDWKINF